ncbi:MAG: hypothetical protein KDJ29_13625 [Hyphomicrobiales bacterium]|nr:hypothetical protein [Hyphomicrobiales bacterium]
MALRNRNSAAQTPAIQEMTGAALADLWSSAIIFAPHLAGCMCAGGFHIPLDPSAVEEDLIDFLRHRYKSEGLKKLAAYADARASDRSLSFSAWLRGLDEAPLAATERRRIITDLRTTLDSMNTMGANPRDDIVCY